MTTLQLSALQAIGAPSNFLQLPLREQRAWAAQALRAQGRNQEAFTVEANIPSTLPFCVEDDVN